MAVESRVKDYLNEHGIKQAFVADRAGINISYFNEKLMVDINSRLRNT